MVGDACNFRNGGGPIVEDSNELISKAYMHELKDVVHMMSPFFKDMIRCPMNDEIHEYSWTILYANMQE